MEQLEAGPVRLSRGGVLLRTRQGPLQFGVPPETIKDTMVLPDGVPNLFVLGCDLFDLERGVNLAELEFPVYFNFFVKRRPILIFCEAWQEGKVRELLRETLFPPVPERLAEEFEGGTLNPALPDMGGELRYFQRHPQHPHREFTFDDVIEFRCFDAEGRAEYAGLCVNLDRAQALFRVEEAGQLLGEVPWALSVPPYVASPVEHGPFEPPLFGITALGTGSGFDPATHTSGFVVWVNGRGIMVDPPVDSTFNLRDEHIYPRLIQDVILTHCHADHDAGVLQKVLEEGIIRLYTTPSIMEGFLRKSSLITGLSREQISQMIEFHPVPVGRSFAIQGARFIFKYNFHSVPTLRFEVLFGGKSLVYSSDILNIPETLRRIHEQGVLSEGRLADLTSFPWESDLIIHEAGIPPLHTPPFVLDALPAEVKARLYVVHTTEARVRDFPGLKMMLPGIKHTLALDAIAPTHAFFLQCVKAMASNDFLRTIQVERAADLLQIAEHRSLGAGEYLIRKGAEGTEVYLLLNGEVRVIRDNRIYKIYGPGELVGDMALVSDEPRFADVLTQTPIRYLAMKKADFIAALQHSGALERLQHLAVIRKQDSWPLLESTGGLDFLTVSQRTWLQGLLQPCVLPEGAELSSRRLELPEVMIVIEGELHLRMASGRQGTLSRGALLGCVGNPDGKLEYEAYEAVARTPVRAYRVQGPGLSAFLERNPGMWLRLSRRARLAMQLDREEHTERP